MISWHPAEGIEDPSEMTECDSSITETEI